LAWQYAEASLHVIGVSMATMFPTCGSGVAGIRLISPVSCSVKRKPQTTSTTIPTSASCFCLGSIAATLAPIGLEAAAPPPACTPPASRLMAARGRSKDGAALGEAL